MKFKNDIEVQAGIKDSSGSDGALGQVLSSTVSGVSWINPPVGVTGSGTTNYLPKWSSSTGLTNSIIFNNGNGVSIGATSSSATSGWRVNIHPDTSQAGLGIFCYNNNSLHGLRIEMTGTGDFIQARDVATQSDVFFVDYLGNATANSFIKTGGTSSQYLMADGSVSTGPSVSGYVPYTGANQNLDLGSNTLLSKNLIINHPSGSGVAASITKGGNGEALTVLKTSGSGNAASILGGVTLLDELHLNTDLADAYISSASTWNAKIGGSGTLNRVPRFTGTSTIADGSMIDNGTFVLVGGPTNTGNITFQVNGNARIANELWLGSTINNGVNVYTLPSSTGTLALTSQLHNPVTIGTANGLSLAGQVLSLAVATATQNGALSSTDWATFNSKQAALNGTGFVKVSGTTVSYDNNTYALDSDVVKLTGNQSIAGVKTFQADGYFDQMIYLSQINLTVNVPGYSALSGTNDGIILSKGSGSIASILIGNLTSSQFFNFPDASGTIALTSDFGAYVPYFGATTNVDLGSYNITADSIIKSGGTSAQILAADGSVITAGTGISISGGTISSTVVGGVTSFNTRTGAVTLTSTDVNTALGYTAANDANVVKLTGDQGILGIKSFNHINGSVENFTTRLNYFFDNGIIRSDVTPLETINNLTSQSIFKVDKDGNTTANSFIKIGGNSTQYLKADGSVSTAMNSRIEVNFTATSGQTTFTTPYEVGQIDVYYNGSKLNPSEFTATNGTTVVLAQAATLNAQISIVKYIGSINGSSGTTNRIAKFTGTVTLGDSLIIDNGSFIGVANTNPIRRLEVASDGSNWISGTFSGTGNTNKVVIGNLTNPTIGGHNSALNAWTDFTIAGDSIIFSPFGSEKMRINGSGNVGIGTMSPNSKLHVVGDTAGSLIKASYNTYNDLRTTYIDWFGIKTTAGSTNNNMEITMEGGNSSNGAILFSTGTSTATERMRITSGGLVLIGTTDAGYGAKLNSIGTSTAGLFLTSDGTSNVINVWANSGGGNNPFIGFLTDGGTQRGNIDFNRGAGQVRYNTTSDANLKNIIGDSDKQKSVDILYSTKIREYSWKDDETNKPQIGVIAQELYETFKGAVSEGSKQELFGSEDYKQWSVDKTAFTFHLIAGWQEHERLIQELTARLEILENK
jgi:hypothetical protein